jgi:hypothetical protein
MAHADVARNPNIPTMIAIAVVRQPPTRRSDPRSVNEPMVNSAPVKR